MKTAVKPARLKLVYRSLIFKVAAVIVVLDQITKSLAVEFLENKPAIEILGKWFGFSFGRNPGAAFSIGTETTIVFTIFAIVVSSLIVWKSGEVANKLWALTAGGFLGGALGNLVDRIFRSPETFHGHVVDFIAFPNFPLFNIADSAVTLSAIAAVLLSLRGIEYAQDKK